MISRRHWLKVPSIPVEQALPQFLWRASAPGRGAGCETAALMLYVALIFMSDYPEYPEQGPQEADATYSDLMYATGGMSRKMVADGLARLIEVGLIESLGNHQNRRYLIVSKPRPPAVATATVPSTASSFEQLIMKSEIHPFFKLPCAAIVDVTRVISPFKHFSLRSKHEMHALKLYLYLAYRRDNASMASYASYDVISKTVGIPRADIRKAINLLITTELLATVDRRTEGVKKHSHNEYTLKGAQYLAKAHPNSNAIVQSMLAEAR